MSAGVEFGAQEKKPEGLFKRALKRIAVSGIAGELLGLFLLLLVYLRVINPAWLDKPGAPAPPLLILLIVLTYGFGAIGSLAGTIYNPRSGFRRLLVLHVVTFFVWKYYS